METKNIIQFLIILTLMAMTSCKCPSAKHKTVSTSGNAALELYNKYAGNPNLTVAYLGDFVLNENKIDALMLQAAYDEDWEQLKSDFGIFPKFESIYDSTDCDTSMHANCDKKVVSIGFGIDTDFIQELHLDTITDISQVDEERLNKMNAIIAEKLHDIINNFPIPDTTLPSNAIIVGDGSVDFGDEENIDMEEYISILAEAIGKNLLNDILTNTDTIADEQNTLPDSTINNAYDYGHKGYVSAADDSRHTLWLFFYDNQEECNYILTHIKDDILIGQNIQ